MSLFLSLLEKVLYHFQTIKFVIFTDCFSYPELSNKLGNFWRTNFFRVIGLEVEDLTLNELLNNNFEVTISQYPWKGYGLAIYSLRTVPQLKWLPVKKSAKCDTSRFCGHRRIVEEDTSRVGIMVSNFYGAP